ncbi:hypothetical protein [Taklimakanibacter albus]|uniref:Uncharacterized protein n=1 Tax=Taklimakanibacter albus TaxID=2800327 RepID=A0ACC5RBT1_9HYPH|nr:hypothetical protein [Aestuariivirga sp. YIM B02566]MBK1869946.1 hypothetical protein [Aestuariivirga sp. YIM B02566]
MTVERQAKRILIGLSNFSEIEREAGPGTVLLHNLFGLYRNRLPPHDSVWIYEDGLIWQNGQTHKQIRYAEIDKIILPHDKRSEHLHLLRSDGSMLELPIRGNDGKFYDSLVFLRFLRKAINLTRPQ